MPSSANRNTRLTALAQKDYLSAIRWYKRNSSERVAERFMLEVEDTLSFMRRSPALFPIAFRDRRKAFLKTFPFQITFVQVEDILVVLGITHTSRDPSNWQGRLLPSEGRRRN